MRALSTTLLALLLTVASTSPVAADAERGTFKPDPSSGEEAGGCTQSGTGEAYFRTCTTSFGALHEIKSPFGATDLLATDGYALCSALGTHGVETGFGGGFGFAVPTTSTPTSNVRVTTDGKFKVTQTFLRDALEKEIIITVTIRNQTTAAISGVKFTRFFDADVADTADFAGATKASAFIFDKHSEEPGRGLELSARTYTYLTNAEFVAFTTYNPSATGCSAAGGSSMGDSPILRDWTGRVTYTIGTIAASASKIIKFVYRVM